MKILHPTDFSKAAEKARTLALDLCERTGATMDVAYVQTQVESFDDSVTELAQDYVAPVALHASQLAREEEVQHYRQRLTALTPPGGISHLLWGNPVRKLLALAPAYDLVVMGAHGANPLDSAILGGVAGRVVRHSPVPVLTVREASEVIKLRRLLVATDFGEGSKHAWRWCQALAQMGIKLAVVHVIDISRLYDDASYTQVVAEAMHNLDREHTAERHIIRQGDPHTDLPKIAQEMEADAIVIGLKHHPAWVGMVAGSLSDALLRASPVPILAVPLAD